MCFGLLIKFQGKGLEYYCFLKRGSPEDKEVNVLFWKLYHRGKTEAEAHHTVLQNGAGEGGSRRSRSGKAAHGAMARNKEKHVFLTFCVPSIYLYFHLLKNKPMILFVNLDPRRQTPCAL
ncbi:hypothetical protein VNO80_21835 [Phaseolus coccineus]|uniref:Uncharacterized protein n=1 Tax=Phaseolus coccineus TaxID=3886 RepID=A0AAN9M326_PHACN